MASAFNKHNFIGRSIRGTLSFFRESVLSEEHASHRAFLQSLDPRVKAATFLWLCLMVLIARNIYSLIFLYVFCLVLVWISKINLGFFLKRTWIFIPLFSLFIAIPALFSFISPGEALLSFNFLGLRLVITRPGFSGALLFVTRVITSVSLIILLGLTTRHFALLKVLRIFKVPQVFVMVLGMSYRYIYLFVEIVQETYQGIRSRVGEIVPYRKGQSLVAWNIATLWQRSFKLNDDVYNAMLSRGYTGEPVLADEFKASFKDWAWVCLVAIISGLALYLNHG
ncbi:MAG: cobalt ECF transporter T component CbiQ [Candidatus Omnitrophica bacterium]|nr:cobalt ECF transporter T component CbiQ [Candidatus Omnitrophota bacterium]